MECPNCGCERSLVVSRKYLVTTLRRCDNCNLLFRVPTSKKKEQVKFYQNEYSQGFTTDVPTRETLELLKRTKFHGTEKDFSGYIKVLEALGCKSGVRVFDYGCSWGYGSWQMQEAGYRVSAFEISVPRCNYAKNYLGIEAAHSLEGISGPVDVFFSAHVIEHVFSVRELVDLAKTFVKPGGLFVAFCPNGSEEFMKKDRRSWNLLWGMVHPNFLDKHFLGKLFERNSYLLATTPYDLREINKWSQFSEKSSELNLNGRELMIVVKRSQDNNGNF